MTILDVMNKIRNVTYVMIHKDDKTKLVYADELEDQEASYQIEWFEVSQFRGKNCIEFNL